MSFCGLFDGCGLHNPSGGLREPHPENNNFDGLDDHKTETVFTHLGTIPYISSISFSLYNL